MGSAGCSNMSQSRLRLSLHKILPTFFFKDMLYNLPAHHTTDHIYNIINELSKPNIFSLPEYFLISSDTYIGCLIIFLLIILHLGAIYLRFQNASEYVKNVFDLLFKLYTSRNLHCLFYDGFQPQYFHFFIFIFSFLPSDWLGLITFITTEQYECKGVCAD